MGWFDSDGASGLVAGSPDLSLGCLVVVGNDLWARGPDIPLVRIDGTSGAVVDSFGSQRSLGAGCVVEADGSLWISSLPFGRVWRLDVS